jgi:hypothetical protein
MRWILEIRRDQLLKIFQVEIFLQLGEEILAGISEMNVDHI